MQFFFYQVKYRSKLSNSTFTLHCNIRVPFLVGFPDSFSESFPVFINGSKARYRIRCTTTTGHFEKKFKEPILRTPLSQTHPIEIKKTPESCVSRSDSSGLRNREQNGCSKQFPEKVGSEVVGSANPRNEASLTAGYQIYGASPPLKPRRVPSPFKKRIPRPRRLGVDDEGDALGFPPLPHPPSSREIEKDRERSGNIRGIQVFNAPLSPLIRSRRCVSSLFNSNFV